MRRTIAIVFIAVLIGSAITYRLLQPSEGRSLTDVLAKLIKVEEELSQTKSNLLGYTKYTDYLSVSKTAMSEKMKFLATKVDREYVHVEHIQKSTLGLESEATIILNYKVEYSFGYDLKPDNFNVSADKDGIVVTLHKPELVASPSVDIRSHEIASNGVLIDEKAAVIDLQQKLLGIAKTRTLAIQKDEAVIALCEKKLGEFLHDFLAKQPNVKVIPTIKFAYK